MKDVRVFLGKNSQTLWLAVLLVFVPVLLGGVAYYFLRESARAEIQNQLRTAATLKAERIAAWLAESRTQVEALANGPQFVIRLQQYARGAAVERQELLDRNEYMRRLFDFDAVLLLDGQGRVSLGSGDTRLPPDVARILLEGRTPGVHLYDLALVRDAQGGERVEMGFFTRVDLDSPSASLVLYARIDARKFLYPLVREWPTDSASAETLLVRREGDEVVFLNELRHRPGTALTFRLPLDAANREHIIAGQALSGHLGIQEGLDYRRVPVLAYAQPIPGTPWIMVAKMDRDEAYAMVNRLSLMTVGLGLVFISGVFQAFLLLRRSESRRRDLERQIMANHFDYLSKYANDAILLADANRRIIEVNDRTMQFYGYARQELLGLRIDDLRAEAERPWVEPQWRELLEAGAMVLETVHRRKDGSAFPVESSLRVIERGGLRFYQDIVRDITERRLAQQRIERLNRFYLLLYRADDAIVRARRVGDMLGEVCRVIVETGGFQWVWVGLREPGSRKLRPAAQAGASGFPDATAALAQARSWEGQGPSSLALRLGRPYVCNDVATDPSVYAWRNQTGLDRLLACAAFPIAGSEGHCGVLCVGSDRANVFDHETVNLLAELAASLSLALDRFQTERRREEAVALLRDREERLSLAMQAGNTALFDFDIAVGESRVSPEYPRMLGYDPASYQESYAGWIERLHPDDLGVVETLRQYLAGGVDSYRVEYRQRTASGDWHWILAVGKVMEYSPEGKPLRLMGTLTDIHSLKTTEQALRDSTERYGQLFRLIPEPLWVYDCGSLAILEANAAAARRYGYAPDEFARLSLADLWPEAGCDSLRVARARHRRKDGTAVEVEVYSLRMRYGGRDASLVLAIDIGERLRYEARLRLSAQVIESSNEGIMIADRDNLIVSVNPAFAEATGYSAAEVVGQNPKLLKSGRHGPEFYARLWQTLDGAGAWRGEIWNRHKDGHFFPEWLSISTIRDEQGEVQNYIGIFTDISEHKRNEERIRHLAYYDALTNLPNRAFFRERLAAALAHAEREGEPMAVFVLDLDHFKHINDSLGHLIGDALLQEAARRMRTAVREQDTVARPGGDEFMLILPGTDADGAAHTAQKIVKALSQPMRIEGHELHISCSLGISLYPDNGQAGSDLIGNADVAMYRAKQRGRNAYQFFTEEMQREAVNALTLEQHLRQALDSDELRLHYQPQVDIRDGRVVGCEALLRWSHPEWGDVAPSRFIRVAEESGLIRDLGLWVLRRAARQLKDWADAGHPPLPTSVNVSALQFHHDGHRSAIGEQVARVLDETGIAPEWLELEITETGLMEDHEQTSRSLNQLRDMGVRVAIDDFGIGYSSLNYLKRFPVSRLKIDQSFVRDIAVDPGDEAIIDTIIQLGRNFGLTVIAEGVETAQQLEKLRVKGCDQAQGFYFSHPLPADQLGAWLRGDRAGSA